MAISKKRKLQAIIDRLTDPKIHYSFTVVYRPGSGYWLEADEGRYFGDEGEWLGHDFEIAAKSIPLLIG